MVLVEANAHKKHKQSIVGKEAPVRKKHVPL